MAKADGNAAREFAADEGDPPGRSAPAARARTDRTRYLGATAALAMAEPVVDAYRKVALVEPLAQAT